VPKTRLPYILLYESWHSHTRLRARSPAKIQRGFYQLSKEIDSVRFSGENEQYYIDKVKSFDITNKYYSYDGYEEAVMDCYVSQNLIYLKIIYFKYIFLSDIYL